MDLDIFVQNVKNRCDKKGIKPTAACRESGAGERLLENMKRGSVPSVEKVQLLARYLGVTVSELLGEADPQAFADLSIDDLALLDAYHHASEEVQKIVDVALTPYKREKTASDAS